MPSDWTQECRGKIFCLYRQLLKYSCLGPNIGLLNQNLQGRVLKISILNKDACYFCQEVWATLYCEPTAMKINGLTLKGSNLRIKIYNFQFETGTPFPRYSLTNKTLIFNSVYKSNFINFPCPNLTSPTYPNKYNKKTTLNFSHFIRKNNNNTIIIY